MRQLLGLKFSRSRMKFFNIIFCLPYCSSIFQTLSGVNSTSKQITSNKTPDTSTTSKCHNVHFNNYYSGPANKDIKVHLLKIENQLADLEKKIDDLIWRRTKQLCRVSFCQFCIHVLHRCKMVTIMITQATVLRNIIVPGVTKAVSLPT